MKALEESEFLKGKVFLVAFLVLLFLSSGCTSGEGAASSAVNTGVSTIKNVANKGAKVIGIDTSAFSLPTSNTIEVTDSGFENVNGGEVTINRGDFLKIKNTGDSIHNVKISGLGIDENIPKGEVANIKLDRAGTFRVRDDLGGYSFYVEVKQ